jgi:hypothetical protein
LPLRFPCHPVPALRREQPSDGVNEALALIIAAGSSVNIPIPLSHEHLLIVSRDSFLSKIWDSDDMREFRNCSGFGILS